MRERTCVHVPSLTLLVSKNAKNKIGHVVCDLVHKKCSKYSGLTGIN